MPRISDGERKFVEDGVAVHVRDDGRNLLDMRHLLVKTGVIQFCNGSCLMERVNNRAKVLVGVKFEVRDMQEMDESKALISATVDCTSLEAYEDDPSQRRFRDYSRLLQDQVEVQLTHMLKGKEEMLHIVKNKLAWMVAVDVVVLGADGNLPDLVSLAVYNALTGARLPKTSSYQTEDGVEDFQVDPDPDMSVSLPRELLDQLPIRITLFDIANHMVADVSALEELCARSALSLLVNRKGQLCTTQIDKAGSLPISSMAQHLANAIQIARELFKLLDQN